MEKLEEMERNSSTLAVFFFEKKNSEEYTYTTNKKKKIVWKRDGPMSQERGPLLVRSPRPNSLLGYCLLPIHSHSLRRALSLSLPLAVGDD